MKRMLYILFLFPVLAKAQTIHITTLSDTICRGTAAVFTATVTGGPAPHYKWKVNSLSAGGDSSVYTAITLSDGDTVKCLLTNSAGDTILDTSNSVVMTVQSMPNAGVITGPLTICAGTAITYADTTPGGVWSASNANASISGGIVTGLIPGDDHITSLDSIYYTVANSCGTSVASTIIEIDTIPQPAEFIWTDGTTINPPVLCVGETCIVNGGDGIEGGMEYSANEDVIYNGVASIYAAHAGADRLFIVSENSCGSDTSSVVITVIGPPDTVLPIIVPRNNICVGDTVWLSDPTAGFEWRASNANATIDGSTGLVTGMDAGIDTIILIVLNQCGQASTYTTITIGPPGKITPTDSLCAGSSITLLNKTAGGVWNSSNAAIATIDQAGTITCLTTGTANISYTYGSCTVSKEITVNPSPSPTTGASDLCIGTTSILSNSTPDGIWSSNNVSVATIDSSGLLAFVDPGTATISYKLISGCAATTIVTVGALPPRVTGADSTCVGYPTILYNTTTGGTWTSSDSTIAITDSSSGFVYGTGIGTATITYHAPDGCSVTTDVTVSLCDSVMIIYPNPVKTELSVYAYTSLYNSYRIINSIGQTMLQNPLNGALTKVNVQSLIPGIYFIKITGGNNEYIGKFVKE